MGFLRRHDDEPSGTRYQMREKLFAIGDDFWVETDGGERAFKVDGKALRVRNTFVLEGLGGEELFKIQEKKLRVRDTMEIEHDGDTVATIKKALITPLRDRFAIELETGGELSAKGNIVDHEYEIERDGEKIAEISKRWFRVRDTYGIEVAPGEDDALILAAVVCIDEMASR
ncbi:MAG TPA: LURP-one-related family protein [Solirubrobacteraceae bacterium]|nr:LURP-one-related family protein [Solirubrobacteraceae bacterium]